MRQKKERPVLVAITVFFILILLSSVRPGLYKKFAMQPGCDIPDCLAFFDLTLSSQKKLWFLFQNKYVSYF